MGCNIFGDPLDLGLYCARSTNKNIQYSHDNKTGSGVNEVAK